MQCDYYDRGVCRSCGLIEVPYADQVAGKLSRAQTALAAYPIDWEPPVTGPETAFRNKAKMVVAGSVDAPTLGILDAHGRGVDLRECGLHSPGLTAALPPLTRFVTVAGLTPYDVPTRRGELKHLLVTESPDGELMARFVLRSTEALSRIRKHLPTLHAALPTLRVATVNLLPEHKAVSEGSEEIVLSSQSTLPMRVNGVTLDLRPRSFFQTNTAMAAALYSRAVAWTADLAPASVWDLYCGVGGFALHLARPGRSVVGVEVAEEAVASAMLSAREGGLDASFVAADATAWAAAQATRPELVVVNPPRRGIGADLAGWLESSAVPHVLYSSCNVDSLARDLAAMPSLQPVRGVVLDMFPQTSHFETLLLLTRH